MKTTFILIAAAFSFLTMQETPKLKGTYTVQFDKKHHLESYRITFSDSTYLKVMRDAVSSKGPIVYDKYKVTLRKNKEDDPIEIDSREIGKDTINFVTRNKSDLSLKINRGKMIRVNK